MVRTQRTKWQTRILVNDPIRHISQGLLLVPSAFQQGAVESFWRSLRTVMSKKVLCERLQRCKMQLPVPCSDRSNELEHLLYRSHVTSEHLEFCNLAISFLKGLHFLDHV